MFHIIIGLFLLALGIWGFYDEYYYVTDIIKGGLPIVMILTGLVATLAGFIPPNLKEDSDNG